MIALIVLTLLAPPPDSAPDSPGPGISRALAQERAAAMASLRYDLSLSIPAGRTNPVRGVAVVRFRLQAPHRVVFDFEPSGDATVRMLRGGQPVPFVQADGHLVVGAEHTAAGENELTIEFVAGDGSLNRNEDFLYSLFVPARAHLAIPCFDQPDLKASWSLALEVPEAWAAAANGAEIDRRVTEGRATVRFAETRPLPTYLFAFAAGRFTIETAERNGRTFRMFHRETDPAKVAHNRDAIFNLHARALSWLEEYTAIPYPFGKFDFVLIPSFQFGGMEHAGAILYNSSSLMLEPTATESQFLERASLIAHETSHMWFGDLVTMAWFDDVWMKEVFANFMAGKIVNPSYPEVNHELRFLLANYPAAYEIDRTAGSNPIRQPLANLKDAGTLYGAIIYQKAPIVMRQLEMIAGAGPFRDGLREYLKQYSFGNATWLDLIRILDARTDEDLASWSASWVGARGRPRLSVSRRVDGKGRLSRLSIVQQDPLGRGLRWPQRLTVTIVDRGKTTQAEVFVRGEDTVVPGVTGVAGDALVLVNGAGLAYGDVELDAPARKYLLAHLEDLPGALTRGAAWVTLWENVVEGRVAPGDFIDTVRRALPMESDEQNTDRVLGYLARAFWRSLAPAERTARAASLEAMLREGLDRASTSSRKTTWFAALRDISITREGVAWLARVWRREERIPGLTLAETDETTLAMELAVREVSGWEPLLQMQLDRIQNPDRRERFAFVTPSLSADPAVREQSFARFAQLENRRREAWVLEAQRYLNHPLREAHARRFVRPSLDLLREIQQTGDIFFPKRWMDATLAGHRSPEAVAAVRDFLARELQFPERLRWIVLSAADDLFRAS